MASILAALDGSYLAASSKTGPFPGCSDDCLRAPTCPSDSDSDTDEDQSSDEDAAEGDQKPRNTFTSNLLRGSCHVAILADDSTPPDRKLELPPSVAWADSLVRL